MADERETQDRSGADALRRALGAIRDLRTRLEQAEQALHEPIAIVGIGCRFPGGASSPAQFWEMLHGGRDVIREVPADRWDIERYYHPDPDVPGRMYSRHGGFLAESLQEFDARFFGISPKEADSLDPQQRLLLETSWEALEHAGIAPSSLVGSDAGVFVGIGTADYLAKMQVQSDPRIIDPYAGTGGGYCVASGRLSFFLGLQGPNIAVDSACSSSLVSVLMAVQSLRNRSCSLALAGGVNAIISPETTVYMCNLRALSTAGRCATFDSSADGYVRGEGAGMLVLKRLADAQRDGDVVHAVLRGGAYNHDGRSAGLTVPNGTAQRGVIAAALADAGLVPADVQYVEAHGTATQLGDPIELHALGAAYGAGRVHPLLVGSVKTNMGHLEAAAGVAGLIKCALALEHGTIPRHLHLENPTSQVDWNSLPIAIPTEAQVFRSDVRAAAGVSSFGISGTIAHVLLEAAPRTVDTRTADDLLPVQCLPLSAMDGAALAQTASNLADAISRTSPVLADIAATLGTGRSHFRERAAIVASDADDAVRQLRLVASGALDQIAAAGRIRSEPPRIAFLFTGQGAQHAGMGAVLDARYPVFRAAIDRCASILDARLAVPLRTLLFETGDDGKRLNETVHTQPALFAIEFALSELLATWGVRPRVVMGHSVGEYVAAVVAGALPLEAALTLVAERGRLMQSLPAGGAMAAMALSEVEVRTLLPHYPSLDLAAVNAPSSCVVSGSEDEVLSMIAAVKATGADATRLSVSHAFHSRLMDPILDDFTRAASGLMAAEPAISVVSNRTGDVAGAAQLGSATYWRDHLRGTVRFADGVATLGRLGADLIIEVGPTPALIGQAKESLPGTERRWLPTLRKGRDELRSLAECAAGLYVSGVEVDWKAFHASQTTRRIPLPTYPWQRERFWKKFVTTDGRATPTATQWRHPLLGGRIPGPLWTFETDLGVSVPAYLTDHRIFDLPLFPATGYIELALAAAREMLGDAPVELRQIALREALRLPDTGTATVQVALTPGENDAQRFSVFSRVEPVDGGSQTWTLHASGEVVPMRAASPAHDVPALDRLRAVCNSAVNVDAYYDALRKFSANYGPAFRGIVQLAQAPNQALAEVRLPESERAAAALYRIHPALLDACLQLAPAAIGFGSDADAKDDAYVPIGIGAVRVHRSGVADVWCHVSVPSDTIAGQPMVSCTVTLLDAAGSLVATLESLTLRRVSRTALLAMVNQDRLADSVYQLVWRVQAAASERPMATGRWLLLSDEPGTAPALADALHAAGHTAEFVHLGDTFGTMPDGYQIDPADPRHATLLLTAAARTGPPLSGMVLLWPYALLLADPSLATLETAQLVVLRAALSLAKALDAAGVPLWIVTRGSQAFPGTVPDVTQAPLWGLGGVIAAENPSLRCVRIDLDPQADARAVQPLVDALLWPDAEPTLAFRDGARHVARLEPAARSQVAPGQALRLEIRDRGQLENLQLTSVARTAPAVDEVEIEVHAAGLNFRDVLNALGAYPGDPGPLGNECAGVVTAVGSNVTRLRVGDEVIAMPQGGIATYVLAPASLTVHKPASLTFAEAATIPVTFLTAQYALHHLGQVQRGDRVLIHAATGGVGMAAMQIARLAGAEIVATAGSSTKRARATALGAHVVADSRSLQFDETVRRGINGDGVDIVLNSLAGDFIPRSLQLLREGGRFVEIGKTGVWDAERVATEFPGVSYHVFFLGQLAAQDPELVRGMLESLLADFASGALTPLPAHVFPLQQAEAAFRYMAQAKHSGKIVITPRVSATIRTDASYLITGGLTGLGLAVARGLAAQGARHLVLAGRRAASDDARAAIGVLEADGVQVRTVSVDVSDPAQVTAMVVGITADMPPLRGVIHAAGVLDDAVLAEMEWEQFARVLAPKVAGAWNLHEATRTMTLDFFVAFSSVAALLGSAGQSNYAAANQFLDTLAHARRARGLPALSINWGSWSDVGMAANLGEPHLRRMAASGLRMIAPEDGVRLLHDLLVNADAPQVAVLPLDPAVLSSALPLLLSELSVRQVQPASRETASVDILSRLRAADVEQRRELLDAMLSEQVVRVLSPGAAYRPDADRTLLELGMDSLMAIELRNRIISHLKVTIAVGDLMKGPTIREVGDAVLALLPMHDAESSSRTVASHDDWESGSL